MAYNDVRNLLHACSMKLYAAASHIGQHVAARQDCRAWWVQCIRAVDTPATQTRTQAGKLPKPTHSNCMFISIFA
eukprot:2993145-Amphidinium_carterae.1